MSLYTLGARLLTAEPESGPATDEPQPRVRGSRRLIFQGNRQLPVAARAEGFYIWDADGKRYLDGSSGAFAVNVGHHNPRVVARIRDQLDKIAFAYRTQFENEPTNELADLLARLSPPGLNRAFFVNSGSEAVETAIKLARQFWWASGRHGKQLVISRQPSYHGATLGALSCTDYAPLNIPFRSMSLPFPRVAAPFCYHCPMAKQYPECQVACATDLERVIHTVGAENVAAFICEPIGGASTGAAVPPDEYFPIVEKICHDNEVLLVIDDVLTGCGRTGTFNGYAHWDIAPDIVAMSKGLSGGYTPIGACISTERITEPIIDSGGFMHGHTYAGNPLSAAIACEVIKVVLDEKLVENARDLGVYMHERLRALMEKLPIIGDVRGRGLLAGVELVKDRVARTPFPASWFVAQDVTAIAQEKGLIVYPRRSVYGLWGDHVLLAPPLTIDRAGVDEMLGLFGETLRAANAMLEKHVQKPESSLPLSEPRYEPPPPISDPAIGRIEDTDHEADANATWMMQDPELQVHGAAEYVGPDECYPEHESPTRTARPTSEVPTSTGSEDESGQQDDEGEST